MSSGILPRRWPHLLLIVAALCMLLAPVLGVKHENFKTCEQSGFCKRNRQYADEADAKGASWESPYELDSGSLQVNDGSISGVVNKKVDGGVKIEFPITISFLKSGVARVEVDEARRQKGNIIMRHESKARKERYNEAAKWAISGGLEPGKSETVRDDSTTRVKYGPDNKFEALIHSKPFSIDFLRDGEAQVRFNSHGLLNMEHWRPKIEKSTEEGEEKAEGPDESTWWDEAFGGNTDSKPRGPESIGMDIAFSGYDTVYGIPEHAGPLSLKGTRGGSGNYEQPYRLYNSDVFEYEMDSPMTLYGSIPFMYAHRKNSTVGVFWLNAAELWVDVVKEVAPTNKKTMGLSHKDTRTHWFSESGTMDVFVFLGPTPKDVLANYAELTGTTTLPAEFSIAYHQCRWNYVTDEDVRDVDRKFDKHRIPYDVIWLDIEYTDGKKYFTWDPDTFPDPLGMQKQLDEHQRKLVAIIDPHIKNEGGYSVNEDMKKKGLAVNNKDGNVYDGWCWPGSSNWIDCFNPAARAWWKTLYTYTGFPSSAKNLHLWNDMNEPSVFNGPETTMPKDNLHHDGWEHRDLHNLNGMTFHNATYEALISRDSPAERAFVLTRAFFSGSQRTAAMWTGDNQAAWDHLEASLPMVLAQNIAGFPFAGADVGGFFGNPSKELLARWYQAGAFYPFMRGHAHIDTRRREPYLAGEPYTGVIAEALRLRYSLLPAWYTAFHESSLNGAPVVRPNFYVHPGDDKGFAVDDQMYLGDTGLLVKPVTAEGGTSVEVYLADNEAYYDYFDFSVVQGGGKRHKIDAPLEKLPLLMQGGHVIPRKDRPRRSSGLMRFDPYTLVVVLDSAGNARGELYDDDGTTFDYRDGMFVWRSFEFDGAAKTLASSRLGEDGKKAKAYAKAVKDVVVEKVIVVAAPAAWAGKIEVAIKEGGAKARTAGLTWHKGEKGKASWAVVRSPGVGIAADWTIDFS